VILSDAEAVLSHFVPHSPLCSSKSSRWVFSDGNALSSVSADTNRHTYASKQNELANSKNAPQMIPLSKQNSETM